MGLAMAIYYENIQLLYIVPFLFTALLEYFTENNKIIFWSKGLETEK